MKYEEIFHSVVNCGMVVSAIGAIWGDWFITSLGFVFCITFLVSLAFFHYLGENLR